MSNPVGLEPCNLLADLPVIDSRLVQSYPELAEVASVIARNSELFASRVRTALAERGVREVADILAEPAHEKIIGDVGAPIEVMRHWLGVTLPIRHIGGDNKSVISPIPLAVPFLGIKLLRDLAEWKRSSDETKSGLEAFGYWMRHYGAIRDMNIVLSPADSGLSLDQFVRIRRIAV